MEHLNRSCKTTIGGVGVNVSEKSIDHAAISLCKTQDVCKNFDLNDDIHAVSSSHTAVCVKKDVGLIVNYKSLKCLWKRLTELIMYFTM